MHELCAAVPQGSRVVDIGCGSGLFLNYLAHIGKIEHGVGVDLDARAIAAAIQASSALPAPGRNEFMVAKSFSWPERSFDVATMIDVMHHIPAPQQFDRFDQAVGLVRPGGLVVYKDIGARPVWKAWANRMHDLAVSGDWIHYLPKERLLEHARRTGLRVAHQKTIEMLWYRHELIVFGKAT